MTRYDPLISAYHHEFQLPLCPGVGFGVVGLGPPNTTACSITTTDGGTSSSGCSMGLSHCKPRFSEGLPPFLDAELLRLGRHLHVPCRVLG